MPKFEICISPEDGTSPLPASGALSCLMPHVSYHEAKDWRHPLGVYNTSIQRITGKVSKCSQKLEKMWLDAEKCNEVQEEVIDYLELSLYAAAEHVDDIQRIASTFFRTDLDAKKSRQKKKLTGILKPLRDEISSFTNTIKHAHGRIRLYDIELTHAGNTSVLVGFFIEGYKDGSFAPNPILHSSGKQIISITSFLWSILTFLSESSEALFQFLSEIKAFDVSAVAPVRSQSFQDAVLNLARIPLYSFDEEHPFNQAKWVLNLDDEMEERVNSGIYGSFSNRWLHVGEGKFGRSSLRYAGDGVTRGYILAAPKGLSLQHWE